MSDENHNNANMKTLTQLHGSNAGKAFETIRTLGGYGDVPNYYRGGLDTTSATLKEGQEHAAQRHDCTVKEAIDRGYAVSDDNIKRIEDVMAGDKPR